MRQARSSVRMGWREMYLPCRRSCFSRATLAAVAELSSRLRTLTRRVTAGSFRRWRRGVPPLCCNGAFFCSGESDKDDAPASLRWRGALLALEPSKLSSGGRLRAADPDSPLIDCQTCVGKAISRDSVLQQRQRCGRGSTQAGWAIFSTRGGKGQRIRQTGVWRSAMLGWARLIYLRG